MPFLLLKPLSIVDTLERFVSQPISKRPWALHSSPEGIMMNFVHAASSFLYFFLLQILLDKKHKENNKQIKYSGNYILKTLSATRFCVCSKKVG